MDMLSVLQHQPGNTEGQYPGGPRCEEEERGGGSGEWRSGGREGRGEGGGLERGKQREWGGGHALWGGG